MIKFLGLITIALACLPSAGLPSSAAFAEDGAWRVGNDQIHIVDRGVDTRTPKGRARLLAHVEHAAHRLCRDRLGEAEQCEARTIAETVSANRNRWGQALALALDEAKGRRLAAR